MDTRDIIARKRDGGELRPDEIADTISAYMEGRVSDAQMAALLMAVLLRGMNARETADLTRAMVESGERLDLSGIPGTKVDKHSTGGVGDKTTLVVAPLVASFGVKVPKMSGRALGHTGGTIDKLECIPGLSTEMSPNRFISQVSEIGVAIAAQSPRMCPADKRIYTLRDATATVESSPLIASSVMSKKLAVGADAIVLDVKVGGGAFVEQERHARELAGTMVEIGSRMGKRVVALITRMEQPLGSAVGDGPEMVEAIQTLRGRGPDDFTELCELVAGYMLWVGGAAETPERGRGMAREGLREGRGLVKMRAMIEAQGGGGAITEEPESLLRAANRIEVRLEGAGSVAGLDARRIGEAVRELKAAAGEARALCGVLLHSKVGDSAQRDDVVATVLAPPHARDAARRTAASVSEAFLIGRPVATLPALIGVIES